MFIKICGITNEADALLSVALGADALGFVMAPSRRRVTPSQVADIVKRLPSEVATFGVFVDEDPEIVAHLVDEIGLTGAQLHGSEGIRTLEAMRQRVRFLIKAVSADGMSIAPYLGYPVDALLLDSEQPGSGLAFDWSLIDAPRLRKRIILAGGLRPDNVAEAIATVKPWGVDVSSGVEASAGRKDPVALRSFISNARAAFERLGAEAASGGGRGEAYNWEENL
ncbi:MAG: phosphoribosylanthranilate isomerase [Nitrospiraceae bacterium]|nr:phosphoribosylanthranilate isomerase [Nitrospiraceae bacterium]MDA8375172.1 phosphoribosylanthranilate isomerase [Actinomycetota bacterium]